jgi:DNA-binding NarL/FixJ family response regulator
MIRLAIVEDDLLLLEAVARNLRTQDDFEVGLQVTTAEAALEFNGWASIHLVLVDLNLPSASGIDLIANLSQRYPELSILVHTVYEDRETVFAALKNGAEGYILKGDTEPGICESIRKLLGGGSPLSPTIARWIIEFFRSSPAQEEATAQMLSTREIEVLQYLAGGLLYKEIADRLKISTHTVHAHIRNIYAALKSKGRKAAVQRAKMLGYLE